MGWMWADVWSVLRGIESAASEAECRELLTLAERVPRGGCIAEVGTYRGRSLTALAIGAPPAARVHGVDLWEDVTGVGGPIAGRAAAQALGRAIQDNPIRYQRVVLHKGDSVEVAAGWTEGEIDLLFIDGDHSEWGVRRDWRAWCSRLAPGAIVAWHDYGRDAPFAVRPVVDEVVGFGGLEVLRQVDSLLVTKIPDFA